MARSENKSIFHAYTYELITTSNAAWSAPAGTKSIDVFMIGGGSGGGSGDFIGIGGPAGNTIVKLGVVPSGTYALVIGAGGLGNSSYEGGGATTGFGFTTRLGEAYFDQRNVNQRHGEAAPIPFLVSGAGGNGAWASGGGGWGVAGVTTGHGGDVGVDNATPYGAGGSGASNHGTAGCIVIRYDAGKLVE